MKNELCGAPPTIVLNPRNDMSGQFAKRAKSLVLLRLATDSNLAVPEVPKEIASVGLGDAGAAAAAAASTVALGTENRGERTVRTPAERRPQNENSMPSAKNMNRWRTAEIVRLKLRRAELATRMHRGAGGGAGAVDSVIVPIERKVPPVRLTRRRRHQRCR